MPRDTVQHTDKERRIFEELSIPKALAFLIVPTIISQIIHVVYNMADTWFVGLAGDPQAMAALSLTMPLFSVITALSNLFGIGGSGLIARSLGVYDYEKAKRGFSLSFWCSIFLTCAFMVIMGAFMRPILFAIGAEAANIDLAVSYTRIALVLGGFPMIISTTVSHLVRALGDSGQAGFGLTLGALLNIGLDPLFMFVLLPKGQELAGAAIATAISNFISLAYFGYYLFRRQSGARFSLSVSFLRGSGPAFREILVTGFPSFIMILLPAMSISLVNALVRDYAGSVAVAGVGIARKIDSLAFSVNQGITQGMLPFVSYQYSSGRIDRMKKAIGMSAAASFGFSLCSSTVSWLFAPELIWLFIRDPGTIAYGVWSLRILCLSVPIYSVTYIVIAAFQSTGRLAVPLILAMRRGVLDSCIFLLISTFIGPAYVLWGSPVAETIALAVGLILLFRLFAAIQKDVPGS